MGLSNYVCILAATSRISGTIKMLVVVGMAPTLWLCVAGLVTLLIIVVSYIRTLGRP